MCQRDRIQCALIFLALHQSYNEPSITGGSLELFQQLIMRAEQDKQDYFTTVGIAPLAHNTKTKSAISGRARIFKLSLIDY